MYVHALVMSLHHNLLNAVVCVELPRHVWCIHAYIQRDAYIHETRKNEERCMYVYERYPHMQSHYRHMYMHASTYVCMQILHKRLFANICMPTYVFPSLHTYTHTLMHARMHEHIHTCSCTQAPAWAHQRSHSWHVLWNGSFHGQDTLPRRQDNGGCRRANPHPSPLRVARLRRA